MQDDKHDKSLKKVRAIQYQCWSDPHYNQFEELLPTLASKTLGSVGCSFHNQPSGIAGGLQGGLAPKMADPPCLPCWLPQALCPFKGIPMGGGATPSCPSGGSSGVWGWRPYLALRTWRVPVVLGTLEGVSIYYSYLGVWERPQERFGHSRGLPMPLWRVDQRESSKLVRCRFGVSGPWVRSHGDGFGSGEHCGRLGR